MDLPHTDSGQGINCQYPPYAPLAVKPLFLSLKNSMTSCQANRQLVSTLDSPQGRKPSSYMTLPPTGYMSPTMFTSLKDHQTLNKSQSRFVESPSHIVESQDISVDVDVEAGGEGDENEEEGGNDAGVEADEVVPSGEVPMEPRQSGQ